MVCCNNCRPVWKRLKINEKEARNGPLKIIGKGKRKNDDQTKAKYLNEKELRLRPKKDCFKSPIPPKWNEIVFFLKGPFPAYSLYFRLFTRLIVHIGAIMVDEDWIRTLVPYIFRKPQSVPKIVKMSHTRPLFVGYAIARCLSTTPHPMNRAER